MRNQYFRAKRYKDRKDTLKVQKDEEKTERYRK